MTARDDEIRANVEERLRKALEREGLDLPDEELKTVARVFREELEREVLGRSG